MQRATCSFRKPIGGTPLGLVVEVTLRFGYLVAQAKRVTGGIDQHAPAIRARLHRRSSGPQGDGGALAVIKVGHRELEMQLLRNLPGGPQRHAMLRDPLHGDEDAGPAQGDEVVVLPDDLQLEQIPPELGLRERVGRVERHGCEKNTWAFRR